MPYCFSRSYVKLQGHTALKIVDFDPNWAFPDCISSFKPPMATKWCTKLEVALKRCPIVFQGHPTNFKVTRLWKSSNLTQIGRFRTVTVWIHWWIWNDAQSLMLYRRHVLLFFEVIHQISRSHGRKIDDLNPIWVRLLGRSQLSNPSDLPCFCKEIHLTMYTFAARLSHIPCIYNYDVTLSYFSPLGGNIFASTTRRIAKPHARSILMIMTAITTICSILLSWTHLCTIMIASIILFLTTLMRMGLQYD